MSTWRSTARDVLALAKPSITFMSVIMAGVGLMAEPETASAIVALSTLVGTALLVGSANALNMALERHSDGLMHRTKDRPLPAGRLQPWAAWAFGLGIGVAGAAVMAAGTNALATALGVGALVTYVGVYTPMKRWSPWALAVGAVPGAMPPLIGWAAATGRWDGAGLVLFGVVFLWQMPHFLAIAIYRKVDYVRAGIRVVPAVVGDDAARAQAVAGALALLPVSLLLLPLGAAGWIYGAFVSVAGLAFLTFCLIGVRAMRAPIWARRVLLASLAYLPLVAVGLAVDRFLLG